MLDVIGLTFGYGSQPALLVEISLSLHAGEVLCILGPNGAGKSTLLRCVLGLHRLRAGAVELDGRDLSHLSRRDIARTVAYVPQDTHPALTHSVLDLVVMGRTPHLHPLAVPSVHDYTLAHEAVARLGIGHLAGRGIHEVSGGERQLALIARALCQGARLLVMDEPTASLDYGNQIRVLRIINGLRHHGYGVIMTAHNPDHAFLSATHAGILRDGRLVAFGPPEHVINSATLTALYAAPVAVFRASPPEAAGRSVTACVPLLDREGDALPSREDRATAADAAAEESRRTH